MRIPSIATATALAAALLVAGCGSGSSSGGGGSTGNSQASGSASGTVNVTETEFKIDPAHPTVAKPGVVEFDAANKGSTVHALEVVGPGGEAKTAAIQPGSSAKLKVALNKPGTYTFYCPIDGHRAKGMEGSIVVAGGSSGGGQTTTGSGGGSNGGGSSGGGGSSSY